MYKNINYILEIEILIILIKYLFYIVILFNSDDLLLRHIRNSFYLYIHYDYSPFKFIPRSCNK